MTTINGSRKFTIPKSVIAEKNKINSSLSALGKDLELNYNPFKADTTSAGYNKSNLTKVCRRIYETLLNWKRKVQQKKRTVN
ncbi:hypothetical protein IKE_05843 [Bacillus cereus VD196]|uniref:Uncharacterized protein n=1 Tax=Bacillus cereus VD196 TaxID=1053243 RepID=A0A9W5V5Y9_BACCE|nr:hypothetical protein [Bacillus cereus]EJR93447.1 hypothetical protein IKG_05465 [Bacillus cereus VD200]EOO61621.1 hypothetical protein IKE_05843 [Bacillus cereus VD196]